MHNQRNLRGTDKKQTQKPLIINIIANKVILNKQTFEGETKVQIMSDLTNPSAEGNRPN